MPAKARSPKRLGYLLNRMREKGSRFAVALLADNSDLANLKPAATGAYLLALGPTSDKARDALFNQLDERKRGSDAYDALDLQIIRALGERGRLGTAEGRVFESIALDTSRRGPIRSWALKAWGRSDAWESKRGAEAADAGNNDMVRRAALVPFIQRASDRRTRLLRHMRERHPDLKYTVRWIGEEAA